MSRCYYDRLSAHIARNCTRPLVGGYTGRALLIAADDWQRAKLVIDAENPQKIRSVILATSTDVQVFVVENYGATPFTGSTTAGNVDAAFQKFMKTLTIRVPMRGADAARKVVQPLARGCVGYVAIIEKRDKIGDGSFEIVGLQQPLFGDAATISRDESAGGAWSISLTTSEMWAEATLVGYDDNYESARDEYRALQKNENRRVEVVYGGSATEGRVVCRVSCIGDLYYSYRGGALQYAGSNLQEDMVEISDDVPSDTYYTLYGTLTALAVDCDTTEAYDCQMESLTFSNQTKLKEIYCYSNQLTALDVSKNAALQTLYCSSNQLTALDVSKNAALQTLDCSGNQLTALDVSKNAALQTLYCSSNQLTALDVSKNAALQTLYCSSNQLTALDVSGCAKINYFLFLPSTPTTLATIRAANVSEKVYSTLNSNFAKLAATGTLTTDGSDASATLRATAAAKGWTIEIV